MELKAFPTPLKFAALCLLLPQVVALTYTSGDLLSDCPTGGGSCTIEYGSNPFDCADDVVFDPNVEYLIQGTQATPFRVECLGRSGNPLFVCDGCTVQFLHVIFSDVAPASSPLLNASSTASVSFMHSTFAVDANFPDGALIAVYDSSLTLNNCEFTTVTLAYAAEVSVLLGTRAIVDISETNFIDVVNTFVGFGFLESSVTFTDVHVDMWAATHFFLATASEVNLTSFDLLSVSTTDLFVVDDGSELTLASSNFTSVTGSAQGSMFDISSGSTVSLDNVHVLYSTSPKFDYVLECSNSNFTATAASFSLVSSTYTMFLLMGSTHVIVNEVVFDSVESQNGGVFRVEGGTSLSVDVVTFNKFVVLTGLGVVFEVAAGGNANLSRVSSFFDSSASFGSFIANEGKLVIQDHECVASPGTPIGFVWIEHYFGGEMAIDGLKISNLTLYSNVFFLESPFVMENFELENIAVDYASFDIVYEVVGSLRNGLMRNVVPLAEAYNFNLGHSVVLEVDSLHVSDVDFSSNPLSSYFYDYRVQDFSYFSADEGAELTFNNCQFEDVFGSVIMMQGNLFLNMTSVSVIRATFTFSIIRGRAQNITLHDVDFFDLTQLTYISTSTREEGGWSYFSSYGDFVRSAAITVFGGNFLDFDDVFLDNSEVGLLQADGFSQVTIRDSLVKDAPRGLEINGTDNFLLEGTTFQGCGSVMSVYGCETVISNCYFREIGVVTFLSSYSPTSVYQDPIIEFTLGSVTMNYGEFADASGEFGAILFTDLDMVSVVDFSFVNVSSSTVEGGAFSALNVDVLLVSACTFSDVSAPGSGAFTVSESLSVIIANTNFYRCRASFGSAGAVSIIRSPPYTQANPISLSRVSFEDCWADEAVGALFVDAEESPIVLSEVDFIGCSTIRYGAFSMTVRSAVMDQIVATGNSVSFAESVGEIYYESSLTVSSSIFEGNVGEYSTFHAFGSSSLESTAVFTDVTFDGNSGYSTGFELADVAHALFERCNFIGNQLIWDGCPECSRASCIYSEGNVTLSECLFMGNYAERTSDTLFYASYGLSYEPLSYSVEETQFIDNNCSCMRLEHNLIDAVEVISSVFLSNSGGDAVMLDVSHFSSFSITDSSFVDNQYNWGVIHLVCTACNGALASFVTRSEFVGNTVGTEDGGALWLEGASSSIINSTFATNMCGQQGGAIFALSSINVDNTDFIGNHANSDGGALYTTGEDIVVENCRFLNNTALYTGGAWGSWTTMFGSVHGSYFDGNQALDRGGAINAEFLFLLTVDDSDFIRNWATNGGGLALESTPVRLLNTRLVNNHAYSDGGGLWSFSSLYDDCHVNVSSQSLFTGNEAGSYGGAIYGLYEFFTVPGGKDRGRPGPPAGRDDYEAPQLFSFVNCSFVGNNASVGSAVSAENINMNFESVHLSGNEGGNVVAWLINNTGCEPDCDLTAFRSTMSVVSAVEFLCSEGPVLANPWNSPNITVRVEGGTESCGPASPCDGLLDVVVDAGDFCGSTCPNNETLCFPMTYSSSSSSFTSSTSSSSSASSSSSSSTSSSSSSSSSTSASEPIQTWLTEVYCTQDQVFRDNECIDCPRGGLCNGTEWIWPIAGFWSKDAFSSPYQCGVSEACPGAIGETEGFEGFQFDENGPITDLCSALYDGEFCADCAAGTKKDNQRCIPCGTNASTESGVLIFITLLVVLLVAAAMVFLPDRRVDAVVSCILIGQTFTLVGRDAARHVPGVPGERLAEAFRILSLFNLDVEFMALDCATGSTFRFQSLFWGSLAIWAIALVAFTIASVLHVVILYFQKKVTAETFGGRVFNRCIHGFVVLLMLAYLQVTLRAVQGLRCVTVDNERRLSVELSTLCFKGEHTAVGAVSVVIFVVFVVPFPLAVMYIVLVQHKETTESISRSMDDLSSGDAFGTTTRSRKGGKGRRESSGSSSSGLAAKVRSRRQWNGPGRAGGFVAGAVIKDVSVAVVFKERYGYLVRNVRTHRAARILPALKVILTLAVVLQLTLPLNTSYKLMFNCFIILVNVVYVALVWPMKSSRGNLFLIGSGTVTSLQSAIILGTAVDPGRQTTAYVAVAFVLVALALIVGVAAVLRYWGRTDGLDNDDDDDDDDDEDGDDQNGIGMKARRTKPALTQEDSEDDGVSSDNDGASEDSEDVEGSTDDNA